MSSRASTSNNTARYTFRESLDESTASYCDATEDSLQSARELTLDTLYDDLRGRDLFKKFVKRDRNSESIMFLEAVEEYQKLRSAYNRFKKIGVIMDQFFRPNSKYELNLPQKAKHSLIVKMKDSCSINHCPIDLFDECVTAVMIDMKEDVWPRFVQSPEFKKYIDLCFEDTRNTICNEISRVESSLCGFDVTTPLFKDEDFDRITDWVKGSSIEGIPWKLVFKKNDLFIYLSEEGIKGDLHQ